MTCIDHARSMHLFRRSLKVPEEEDLIQLLGQPPEVWVTTPVEELGGQTPAQALTAASGQRPAAMTLFALG